MTSRKGIWRTSSLRRNRDKQRQTTDSLKHANARAVISSIASDLFQILLLFVWLREECRAEKRLTLTEREKYWRSSSFYAHICFLLLLPSLSFFWSYYSFDMLRWMLKNRWSWFGYSRCLLLFWSNILRRFFAKIKKVFRKEKVFSFCCGFVLWKEKKYLEWIMTIVGFSFCEKWHYFAVNWVNNDISLWFCGKMTLLRVMLSLNSEYFDKLLKLNFADFKASIAYKVCW